MLIGRSTQNLETVQIVLNCSGNTCAINISIHISIQMDTMVKANRQKTQTATVQRVIIFSTRDQLSHWIVLPLFTVLKCARKRKRNYAQSCSSCIKYTLLSTIAQNMRKCSKLISHQVISRKLESRNTRKRRIQFQLIKIQKQ